jgi:large subunit ribosomal protein L23
MIMEVLKHPVATEKAIRMIESDNILTFVVDPRVTQHAIKKAVEAKFKVKVDDLRVLTTMKGKKKAYVKLNKEFHALDIATQLGLM